MTQPHRRKKWREAQLGKGSSFGLAQRETHGAAATDEPIDASGAPREEEVVGAHVGDRIMEADATELSVNPLQGPSEIRGDEECFVHVGPA